MTTLTLQKALAYIDQAFSETGPLSDIIPRYIRSDVQIEYAKNVMKGLLAQTTDVGTPITMIEAETGTGKTLGYLVPLMIAQVHSQRRAIISTATNRLSSQIVTSDGPMAVKIIEKMFNVTLGIVMQFGRQNFIDYDRVEILKNHFKATTPADPAIPMLDAILSASDRMETFQDLSENGLDLPPGISQNDLCVTAYSTNKASKAYHDHRDNSLLSNITVTNHVISGLEARYKSHLIRSATEPAPFFVIDEADELPNAARLICDNKIALSTIDTICEKYLNDHDYKKFKKHFDAIKSRLIHESKITSKPLSTGNSMDDLVVLMQSVLNIIRTKANAARKNRDHEATDDLQDIAKLAEWVEITQTASKYTMISFSPIRSEPSLLTIRNRPATIYNALWRKSEKHEPISHGTILTSATLSAPSLSAETHPSFRDMTNALWLSEKTDNIQQHLNASYSPEDFGHLTITLADRSVPSPTLIAEDVGDTSTSNLAWIDYVASCIADNHTEKKRTLVLTTSYRDAALIGNHPLVAPLTPLIHQKGTPLSGSLDEYRSSPGTILITPSAWTGINLPGLVDNLVIPRIPFIYDNPLDINALGAILSLYNKEEKARHIIHSINASTTIRKLRQGIGRSPRRASDRPHLFILDPRFPLPDSYVNNLRNKTNQGLAASHARLAVTIPERFRVGRKSAYQKMTIYPDKSKHNK